MVNSMTDEKLGALFGGFAHHYWSVPAAFAVDKIADWHPEVTAKQVERVLNRFIEDFFWQHCSVETDGLEEPELVTEHLVALGGDDFERFLAGRIDCPFCDCDEETLLKSEELRSDIPEVKAIIDFGKTELGLDDEWAEQLVDDCILTQPYALFERKSWVMSVLQSEQYGKIQFRTIEQVRRFRELGNKLYLVMPNPVLRGWKPSEMENAPALPDDIPEKDEDIPDSRAEIERILAPLGGRERARQILIQDLSKTVRKKKIGRNEPCPCGSGKKYKKCCGR